MRGARCAAVCRRPVLRRLNTLWSPLGLAQRDVVSRRSRDACLASVLLAASCFYETSLTTRKFDFNLSEFLSRNNTYLQPTAAEARQDEKVERDEPEPYQRKRHGIALQDSTEVEAFDVVLRLIGNVKSAVAVIIRRAKRRRWHGRPPERIRRPSAQRRDRDRAVKRRHRCAAAQRISAYASQQCESNTEL